MVDISHKDPTQRYARASCVISMKAETLAAIENGQVLKGDVLQVARLAGIMAAKQTPHLIPLCHAIQLSNVEIEFTTQNEKQIRIEATVGATDRTGAEMEALVAASTSALTIYDMCKSADRGMVVEHLRLEEKSGGKSGRFVRGSTDVDQ